METYQEFERFNNLRLELEKLGYKLKVNKRFGPKTNFCIKWSNSEVELNKRHTSLSMADFCDLGNRILEDIQEHNKTIAHDAKILAIARSQA